MTRKPVDRNIKPSGIDTDRLCTIFSPDLKCKKASNWVSKYIDKPFLSAVYMYYLRVVIGNIT